MAVLSECPPRKIEICAGPDAGEEAHYDHRPHAVPVALGHTGRCIEGDMAVAKAKDDMRKVGIVLDPIP